jgi:membrane protein YqaA with SNARE-associated domain
LPEGEVDAKKLVRQLVIGIVLIIVLFAALGYFVKEPVEAFAKAWVGSTGLAGLFLATAVVDTFPAPIPPDVFMGFALLGGKGLWEASLVTGVASVLGGNFAWLLGRSSARIAWVRRLLEGKGKQSAYLVQRNARLAIVLGALTPLPFSVSCIAGGAVGMPWTQLFPLTLLRIPRMVFYLYIMQLGWVSVTG